MKRRTKRQLARAKRRAYKERSMSSPSGESKYGRKKAWCFKNAKWGFEVAEPKPWKKVKGG